jgi:prepilin-type N-terminal cleavage/methylation domain-containing protein
MNLSSPDPTRTAGARQRTRGYTAIEVMMAMAMMGIGAAAVMTMQKTSVQGNLDARKIDVANSIARLWVERLQRDAMQWTLPSPSSPGTNNFSNATLLNNNVTGTWFVPAISTSGGGQIMSPGFDILGRDLANTSSALFCVNIRLTFLISDTTFPQNNLIRADVRVLWPRGISTVPPAGAGCSATDGQSDAPDPITYHAIYTTTAIRENAQP